MSIFFNWIQLTRLIQLIIGTFLILLLTLAQILTVWWTCFITQPKGISFHVLLTNTVFFASLIRIIAIILALIRFTSTQGPIIQHNWSIN